jgi:hypothetical protein
MHRTLPDLLQHRNISPSGCWLWTRYIGQHGYGVTYHDGRATLVHRLAYSLAIGPIPDGLCVLHRCDVQPCFNPEHLFLGTLIDNNADMVAKGRHNTAGLALGREYYGERHGAAKLTERQVREIKMSDEQGRLLAARYGVAEQTICNIRKGRRWAHVVV